MELPEHILSCDWGTSSFRLRLVDSNTRRCIGEVTSENGNSILFNKWKSQPGTDRVRFYLNYLKEAVDVLAAKAGTSLSDLPILISGMASSTIGMKELPYADLPFTVDGHTANAEWIRMAEIISNPVLLDLRRAK